MRAVSVGPAVLMLLLVGNTPVWPQQTQVVASDEMSAAVVEHAEGLEQEREQLLALLERPEVRDVALSHGIDINRVETGAATLSGAALKRLAPHVGAVEARLQQDGLRISSTAIIIILLLIFLIVLFT